MSLADVVFGSLRRLVRLFPPMEFRTQSTEDYDEEGVEATPHVDIEMETFQNVRFDEETGELIRLPPKKKKSVSWSVPVEFYFKPASFEKQNPWLVEVIADPAPRPKVVHYEIPDYPRSAPINIPVEKKPYEFAFDPREIRL